MDLAPPATVGSYDDIAAALQRARLHAGVSYRELHRRVARDRRRRGIPEVPAYDTVYRCLQPGRARIDVDLVLDLVRSLGAGSREQAAWRAACAIAGGRLLPSGTAAEAVDLRVLTVEAATDLVGRSAELAIIVGRPGRWLLTGMAGIGKTALAQAAAVELIRAGQADRALLVELSGRSDRPAPSPQTISEALLLWLGLPAATVAAADLVQRGTLLLRALRTGRVVAVLDDAATASQLDWLPPVPASTATTAGARPWLLVTSRRRLITSALDAVVELGGLADGDAVALLGVPARSGEPAARQLADLAGGLPLALELTRARIERRPDWTLADHAQQVEELQRLHRLDPGVEASLSLSYASLPAELATPFRLLGVLPVGGIAPALLAATLDEPVGWTEQALTELRSRCLVQSAGSDRIRLHDLVAVFAAARCLEEDPPSMRRSVLNRLLDAQAAAAGAATARFAPHEVHRQPPLPQVPVGLAFDDGDQAARWLADERANLLQAVGYAHRHPGDHDRPLHVVRMSILLFRYLDLHGWYDDAERLHGWAAAAAVDDDDRARTLNMWGITAWSAGRPAEAEARLSAALTIYRSAEDLDGEARVLVNLGGLSRDAGDTDAALRYGYRSLQIATSLDDQVGQSVAHNNLGVAHEQAGEHAEALVHHRLTLGLARDLGDRFGEARALSNIADILLCLGEHGDARRLQMECLELSRMLGYDQGIADSLNHLATLDSLAGRHVAAIAGHEQALTIASEQGLDTEVIAEHLAASRERARAAGL